MIGQSFSPIQDSGDNTAQRPAQGGSGSAPVQQAIEVLRLRLPHIFSGGSPLMGAPGSAGAPQGFDSPVIARLLQALGVLPPAMGASAPPMGPGLMGAAPPMGGGGMGSAPPLTASYKPSVNYQPLPGGTAGPALPIPQPNPAQQPAPPPSLPGMGGYQLPNQRR